MKRLFRLIGLIALAATVFYAVIWYKREFSRLPEKTLQIHHRNTKNGVVIENGKGAATVMCSRFQILFESESFFPDYMTADYPIDGRYGGLTGPDYSPFPDAENCGTILTYHARTRTLTMTFKNHRIDYCDYRRRLKVNGSEFSTATGFTRVLIKPSGLVQQLR